MQTVLIVIHIILALMIIGMILIQKTSADELQGLGSGSGMGGVMSHAASANFMTKLTSILIAIFMINCLVLANLAAQSSKSSIVNQIDIEKQDTHKKEDKKLPVAE